jgi:hypothetical protein
MRAYPEWVTTGQRIRLDVHPAELAEVGPGVVDIYVALDRQFFWADAVFVSPSAPPPDVLVGEIVSA